MVIHHKIDFLLSLQKDYCDHTVQKNNNEQQKLNHQTEIKFKKCEDVTLSEVNQSKNIDDITVFKVNKIMNTSISNFTKESPKKKELQTLNEAKEHSNTNDSYEKNCEQSPRRRKKDLSDEDESEFFEMTADKYFRKATDKKQQMKVDAEVYVRERSESGQQLYDWKAKKNVLKKRQFRSQTFAESKQFSKIKEQTLDKNEKNARDLLHINTNTKMSCGGDETEECKKIDTKNQNATSTEYEVVAPSISKEQQDSLKFLCIQNLSSKMTEKNKPEKSFLRRNESIQSCTFSKKVIKDVLMGKALTVQGSLTEISDKFEKTYSIFKSIWSPTLEDNQLWINLSRSYDKYSEIPVLNTVETPKSLQIPDSCGRNCYFGNGRKLYI